MSVINCRVINCRVMKCPYTKAEPAMPC